MNITGNIKLPSFIFTRAFYSLLLMPFMFNSCKKDKEPAITLPAADVFYSVAVRLMWTSPNFTIPADAHFTNFTGIVHHKDSFLWKPGGFASAGLEDVAEIGNNVKLNNEIDSIIAKGKGQLKFNIPAPAITAGFDTGFVFTLQHPCISFASMIAPSPDWFVGINQYSLLQNNQWVTDITVPLYLYDAGTEDGDVFGYNNPASLPQQQVHLLTASGASVLANGNAVLAAIGTIRFTKR